MIRQYLELFLNTLLGETICRKFFNKYYRILSFEIANGGITVMETGAKLWGPLAKANYKSAYAGIHKQYPDANIKAVFILSWDQISKQDYELFIQKKMK